MALYGNGPTQWGGGTVLNISAPTVVRGVPSVAVAIQVITAGSAAGAVYDSTSTSGNSAANQVATIPNTAGLVSIGMPCSSGIVVVPGSGQVVAISFL